MAQQEINVLALVKGEERYVVLFDDAHKSEAMRTLGRWASDPDLSFGWYDAARLIGKVGETATHGESGKVAETERPVLGRFSIRDSHSGGDLHG